MKLPITQSANFITFMINIHHIVININQLTKVISDESALGHIAHSYFELGQMVKYGVAMWHFKTVLDEQLEEGVSNPSFWGSQAFFALLSGDETKAMTQLAAVADVGMGVSMPKTLINDPRYLEIVLQLQDNLNKERAGLGLEPVGS